MAEPTYEDMTAFMQELLLRWKQHLDEVQEEHVQHGIACIEGMIALLVTLEAMEAGQFDFGSRLLARQGWLIGMVEARSKLMFSALSKPGVTVPDARKMAQRLHQFISTRGRNELGDIKRTTAQRGSG